MLFFPLGYVEEWIYHEGYLIAASRDGSSMNWGGGGAVPAQITIC